MVDRLLNGALDAGLNVIDTAECYINSEELIGQAVAARRSEYFLFTKCGHDKEGDNWNPNKMAEQIDRSLRRLKTDRVDLLQLHSCTEEQLRQGDVIEVVTRARDAGKTRFIGYSGDSRAALYAVECGVFDTLQISVNIADQEGIDLAIPAAQVKGMGVIAKRPIANAVWKHATKPDAYHRSYWDRLRRSTMISSRAISKTPSRSRCGSPWRFPEFIRPSSEQLSRTAGKKSGMPSGPGGNRSRVRNG